jgi:hypothetical protein
MTPMQDGFISKTRFFEKMGVYNMFGKQEKSATTNGVF